MSEPTTSPSKYTPPPPPSTTPATNSHHQQPPSVQKNTHIQAFIDSAIEATNPSLRHLASHSSLGSQQSNHSYGSQSTWRSPRSQVLPLSTAYEEQRHPGKPELAITKNTKFYDPEAKEAEVDGFQEHGRGKGSVNASLSSYRKHGKLGSVDGSAVYASDETTLFSNPRCSVVDYAVGGGSQEFRRYKEIDVEVPRSKAEEGGNEGEVERKEEDDENTYPGPLGLFILITGIALSVFLISLDRTIITTVSDFRIIDLREVKLTVNRPFLSSQTSSNLTTISAGMARHIC
jgi:hypothetical protein